MSLAHFIEKSKRRLRAHGPRALAAVAADATISAVGRLPVVGTFGTSVYEREWDVLVVLDACRYDLYDDVVGRGSSLWSVGSSSTEWLANTFGGRDTTDTAYVTANPFSRDLDPDAFGLLDEVWRYAWDDDLGTVPPRPMTDRAVTAAREGSHDRLVVHYMQPHYPFIAGGYDIGHIERDEFGVDGVINEHDIWSQFRFGERDDLDTVERAYRANLEYVLDDVALLFDNVDGRVAVTADHGNALGEYGVWGHPVGVQLPCLRRVPWDVRDCTDGGEYEPRDYDTETSGYDADAQLRHLGYA